MKNKKNNIINFGCRLNIFEGEIINQLANKSNLSNFTIINSCAVTAEAEKKILYEIRKIKKKFPNKKIVLTGCAAQINPKKYNLITEIDYVVGNTEKLNSATWSNIANNKSVEVQNIFLENKTNNHLIEKFEGKARAYVEIQQGCDHRCTFCIIPFGRGNNRSVPIGVIVNRIKLLVKNGYKEVVLTGVDITDYGKDLPGKPNLFQLVKRILNLEPNLKQLRLSSIDCAEITEDFWDLLEEPRLMPHLHLSLQAGNNLILKRMKRRHTREQAIDFCKKVKKIRKDFVFGADLIAGFPTETKDMFFDSLNLIDECNLTHLHVFPFSPRENTPAARMPQVDTKIIKERAKKIRKYGEEKMKKYLYSQIGNTKKVLIENSNNKISFGKDQHFNRVCINEKLKSGEIFNCDVYDVNQNILQSTKI